MNPFALRILALTAILLLFAAALPAAASCSCATVQPCACCEAPSSSCSPALDVDCASDVSGHDHDLVATSMSFETAPVEDSVFAFEAVEMTSYRPVRCSGPPSPAPSYLRLCTLLI